MPDPTASYDDAEVVWSSQFPDGVPTSGTTRRRPTLTTYLTIEDAKQLVNLLGNAITKAIIAQRGAEQSGAEDEDS